MNRFRKDFEEFLMVWIKENIAKDHEIPNKDDVLAFYTYPEAMQFGVYQDFGDSVGVRMFIQENSTKRHFGFYIDRENYGSFRYENRNQARAAALEKFEELYNLKFEG